MAEATNLGRTLTAATPALRVSWPHPRSVTIHVCGEVDLCTAPDLTEILGREIRGPAADILVDLSSVTFFGVAGLDCLLNAGRAADKFETGLRIEPGESYAVSRVFSLFRSAFPEVLARLL